MPLITTSSGRDTSPTIPTLIMACTRSSRFAASHFTVSSKLGSGECGRERRLLEEATWYTNHHCQERSYKVHTFIHVICILCVVLTESWLYRGASQKWRQRRRSIALRREQENLFNFKIHHNHRRSEIKTSCLAWYCLSVLANANCFLMGISR